MMLNAHNCKGSPRHDNALLCLVSLAGISWTDWRRASTTGNCYLAVISTVFVNHIALLLRTSPLATLRVSFVLRLRQSFPEDCARLKLSSARASQAGLKEMMTRRRVRDLVVRSYFQSTIVALTIAFAIASSEASLTS